MRWCSGVRAWGWGVCPSGSLLPIAPFTAEAPILQSPNSDMPGPRWPLVAGLRTHRVGFKLRRLRFISHFWVVVHIYQEPNFVRPFHSTSSFLMGITIMVIRSNVAEHSWPEVIERNWYDARWISISQVWGFLIPIFHTGFSLYTVGFLSIAISLRYLTFKQERIK